MNRRVLILLLLVVVVVIGGAAVVLLNPPPAPTPGPDGTPGAPLPVANQATATPLEMVNIVVAIQELPRGIRIPEQGAIAVRPWPASARPERAVTDPAQVIGRIARTDIGREQPIVDTLLVDDLTQIARTGSDAAGVIPDGKRAIAVPMDRLTGLAYGIVMATMWMSSSRFCSLTSIQTSNRSSPISCPS